MSTLDVPETGRDKALLMPNLMDFFADRTTEKAISANSLVKAAAVSEAIRISEEKYCSVEAMLRHTATITTT